MAKIKNGVGVPVKASPSDEIVLTNAPDHEKQLKRIFALLNAGGEPARITEELAQTIVDDVADMQMNHNGMEDALKHERAETKILSVALSEIYRSLYGYEPTRLFPIEDTMTNIRSRIEQLKSGHKHAQYLEQRIRDVHHKLKCPDSDVKDIEALFEEISIRTSSLIEIMKASFNDINGQVDKTTDSELLDKERETLEWRTESIREIAEQLGVNYLTESVKHAVLEIKAEIERREKDAYIELRQVGKLRIEQDNAKKHILRLTESLRSELFAGDASSLTLEEAIDLLSIALANRLPAATNKEAMNLLSIALAKRRSRGAIKPSTEDDELPRTQLEEFVERLYEAVYGVKPVCVGEHIIDNLYKRLENIVRKDKEEREKCTKLEREIARLNYQTSKLRFSENSALEKKAEVWAIKAIEYRILLSTVERRLRGMWTPEPAAANTVSMSDVEDMADLIAEGIGHHDHGQ